MNVHPRVSVSEICSFGWSLPDDLDFYARCGITKVGISVAKMESHGWRNSVELVRGTDLDVADLIGLGPFDLADPEQWPNQRARLLRAVDTAKLFDAGCVIFTTGPSGALRWDDAANRLERAMSPVLERAHSVGVEFALEHTNSLRVDIGFVHTARDVIDLARRLGVGVCIELNACWAERGIDETLRANVDVITMVQVSDFAIGTRTTPERLVPGDGDIPLARLIHTLLDAGYAGDFELELIGPHIEAEGYEKAIPRAIEWMNHVLAE